MENQQFVSLPPQIINNTSNIVPEDSEEGEIIIQKKIKKICLNKKQESDSQWSLSSLDEMEGIDLKKLQAEQQGCEVQQKVPQKQKIEVTYPQKPQLKQNSPIHLVGSVIQLVGDLLIVQSCNAEILNVVDLDGWVCHQNKQFIGFVIDVFGRVQHPFYAIKPEQGLLQPQSLIGKQIYYIQGTKVLNQQTIKSIKSKNKLDQEIQVESSSQDQQKGKQLSLDKPQIYRQHRNNFVRNKNGRKGSFDNNRVQQRSRTRDNFRGKNANQNDKYLQSMYAMHYAQMMQFYSPTYQTPTVQPFNGFPNQHQMQNNNNQMQNSNNPMQNNNQQYPFPPSQNQFPNFPPGNNNFQGGQNNWQQQYKK